ncbi:MAG: tRNA (guanosine(37)-N1)-methyltransferase TrmD [Clostridia bacterium]|nr:tRNA (guanosine(37)-N1)-methyltransferase TrmD [Clostridia bacterium]
MHFKIFTLFPGMFEGPFNESLIKKAIDKGILTIDVINFRDYAFSKHQTVDDTPFGGGQGMLLKPEPLIEALEQNTGMGKNDEEEIILLSPQGKRFTQKDALLLSQKKELSIICGHYEGFDERIRDYVTKEYSIGDYVLTGGEIPAMVMVDCISRLVPGVIKEESSFLEDSFYNGLLEYPHYTKPRNFRGKEVPEILLSGHHENIRKWRLKEALRRTLIRRPDLLENRELSKEEIKLLKEIRNEEF